MLIDQAKTELRASIAFLTNDQEAWVDWIFQDILEGMFICMLTSFLLTISIAVNSSGQVPHVDDIGIPDPNARTLQRELRSFLKSLSEEVESRQNELDEMEESVGGSVMQPPEEPSSARVSSEEMPPKGVEKPEPAKNTNPAMASNASNIANPANNAGIPEPPKPSFPRSRAAKTHGDRWAEKKRVDGLVNRALPAATKALLGFELHRTPKNQLRVIPSREEVPSGPPVPPAPKTYVKSKKRGGVLAREGYGTGQNFGFLMRVRYAERKGVDNPAAAKLLAIPNRNIDADIDAWLAKNKMAPVASKNSVNNPSIKAPVAKSPAAKTPTANVPAANTPGAKAPAATLRAANTPAANIPTAKAPAATTPAANTLGSAMTPTSISRITDQNNHVAPGVPDSTSGVSLSLETQAYLESLTNILAPFKSAENMPGAPHVAQIAPVAPNAQETVRGFPHVTRSMVEANLLNLALAYHKLSAEEKRGPIPCSFSAYPEKCFQIVFGSGKSE